MKKKNLPEQLMVTIAVMHLSGIQKGIQTGHAVSNAYQPLFGKSPEYKKWAKTDKTIYILQTPSVKSLWEAAKKLESIDVPVAKFCEPALDDILTAIAFLVDEEVFRSDLYPDVPLTENKAYLRTFLKKYQWATN